ncbi:MAG: hypothetical protein NQ127_02005 [Candidatus Cardinium sp.]|nr:hypothetical protein [Candidatus Cardinium sp.]
MIVFNTILVKRLLRYAFFYSLPLNLMHCSSCKRTVHKSNTLPSFLENKERNGDTAQQPSPLYTSPASSELESSPINKRRNNSGSPNNKTNEEEIPNTPSRLTGSKADSKSKYNSESEHRTNLESENKPKLSESNSNTRQRNNSDSPNNHENDNPLTPSRQKPKHRRLTKKRRNNKNRYRYNDNCHPTKEATPPTSSMLLHESIPPQQKDPNLSVLLNNTRPEASAPPLHQQIPLVSYSEMPAPIFIPMPQNYQNLTPTQKAPLYPTLPDLSLYQPPCNPTTPFEYSTPLSNESLSKHPLPQDPPPYSR